MEQPHEESFKSQAERAYTFFVAAEQTQYYFTPEELAEATGYTVGTAKIYLTKKWWWFAKRDQGVYMVQGLIEYPLQAFLDDLSQKIRSPSPVSISLGDSPQRYWVRERIPLPLALVTILLLLGWAMVLLLLRKQPWWIFPL